MSSSRYATYATIFAGAAPVKNQLHFLTNRSCKSPNKTRIRGDA